MIVFWVSLVAFTLIQPACFLIADKMKIEAALECKFEMYLKKKIFA